MTYMTYYYHMKKSIINKLELIDMGKRLKERLKDPKFKKVWEEIQPELQIKMEIMRRRIEKDMSQKELAWKMKTDQATISRLEAGTSNPSLNFLRRVAKALDAKLTIRIS